MSCRIYTLSLNIVAAATLAVVALFPTLTAERPAPEGGFVAHSQVEATLANSGKAINRPAWKPAYADRFADCSAAKPAGVPQAVIAVVLDGSVHRVATTQAWTRVKAGDFWVVGFCR